MEVAEVRSAACVMSCGSRIGALNGDNQRRDGEYQVLDCVFTSNCLELFAGNVFKDSPFCSIYEYRSGAE